MKRNILLACIGALILQSSVQAVPDYGAFYSFDDFTKDLSLSYWVKTPGGLYTSDGGLTTQPSLSASDLAFPQGWITTDANQNDVVSTAWAAYAGDKTAGMGYFGVPSTARTELWTPVQTKNITFNAFFGITQSSVAAPTQDDFAWTVRDTSGNQLFALRFKPCAIVDGAISITGTDAINGYQIYKENAAGVDVASGNAFYFDSEYQLSLHTDLYNHTYTANITPINKDGTLVPDPTNPGHYLPTATVVDNTLGTSGYDTEIGAVAATWILNDPQSSGSTPTNAGDNLMIINNYQVIPEPSTVALVIGGLGILTAFQRRRQG